MKTLQHAFVLGAAILAGSTVFAGSAGPGNPQGGQAIALSNLNAAIVSGTISGFYAGGSSTTPGLVGGFASGGFAGGGFAGGGFAPSAPSGPSSLLLPPSDPAFLRTSTGGGTTNSNSNTSNSNTSNSNSSNSNSSNSNSNSNSNSSGSNSTNNSSNNTPGGGSSGSSTGGTTFFSALAVTGPQDVASVPDNGTAIAFLGAALAGLALFRRTFRRV